MTIIDKIKKSVEESTGLAFYYDTPQTLTYRADNVTMPCAMMNIATAGTIYDENGIIHERLTIQVLFVNTSELDFDGIENERERLDTLKKAAFRWLLSLRRSEDLRLISEQGTSRYYATEDAICTAYGVTVTIEEIEGVCYGKQRTTAKGDSDNPCGCKE